MPLHVELEERQKGQVGRQTGRWLMERVKKKNGSEGWGREGERRRERENDIVRKELLAVPHPQIPPALRTADTIHVRHGQPSTAKCLIMIFQPGCCSHPGQLNFPPKAWLLRFFPLLNQLQAMVAVP